MSTTEILSENSGEDEVAHLLDVLLKTGQRLEELTVGQVDTATDSEGRMLLLRGTREQFKHNQTARQAAILNALPANIALLDTDGIIISVNDSWRMFAAANRMQFVPGQALGQNYLEICENAIGVGSEQAHLIASGIRSVMEGSSTKFSLDYDCGSLAEQCWYELSVTPLSIDASKGVVIMHGNVTASKQDKLRLLMLTERLSLATEVAQVGVWEWDLATNQLTWDATMFSIYGWTRSATLSYAKWTAAVHPEDLPRVEATHQRVINNRSVENDEFRIFADGDRIRYISSAQRGVVDHFGTVCRVIGVNVDVTERMKAEEDLRSSRARMAHLAEHDFLTDLPNQMVLKDRLDQAIKLAARNNKKAAVLFLDMDGFKHINDSLGHPVGDKLLQSVAKRLVEFVRASDTVSRLGGDEFIVLFPDVEHPEGTAVAAGRMLNAVAGIHSIGEHELQVSVCIGISIYPDDGETGETLIKNADAAMYQAKRKGNSSYEFFHPNMNVRAMERQFIEQNLRRALERNELALHYQPKVDLKTRTITGVEALLRWTHPVRGAISPGQFISVAEDCGLILPIGMWVLQEACEQASAWKNAGLDVGNIAVNVSGRQLQSERFHDHVLAILAQTHMNSEQLELEVTESLLMKRPELAASLLHNLRREGVKVAIDDFGTGYSSLSHLQRLPIDTLKIDQSFVRQIDTQNGVSIVAAIIQMGHGLGMRLVAEGVETEREADILQGMGCEEAQGYYFSRPVTPGILANLLKDQSNHNNFRNSLPREF